MSKRSVLWLVLTISLTPSAAVLASDWRPAGGRNCADVCYRYEQSPLYTTGNYTKNPELFAVCKANARGQGDRPGYNLQKSNLDKKCFVGYLGKEVGLSNYYCLCRQVVYAPLAPRGTRH